MNIYMNIHIININLKCCSCQVGSTIHPQINLIFIFLKAQVYKCGNEHACDPHFLNTYTHSSDQFVNKGRKLLKALASFL